MVEDSGTDRERGHALLDSLPEERVPLVNKLLEALTGSVPAALADAEVENEELSDFARQAIAEGRVGLRGGGGLSHEEMLEEFGL